jgi:hypothetical protein
MPQNVVSAAPPFTPNWLPLGGRKKPRIFRALLMVLCAATIFGNSSSVLAQVDKSNPSLVSGVISKITAPLRERFAEQAGVKAVIYGLPLVLMDITMEKMTNQFPGHRLARPVNQFAHMRAFPTAAFKDVVRANVDTLYSSAFLNLTQEPLVLTVPNTNGRYYLLPMLDAWTNVFASPGSRTTGTQAGTFLITGPDWSGTVPAGMTQLKSPTNMAWILGRTQTNGPTDYAAVHTVQNGYRLIPLSRFGKPYTPPPGTFDPTIDMKKPPIDQVQDMNSNEFFNRLARLLKTNPPPASEAPLLAKLAKIGIKPGEPFDPAALDPAIAKGLERSVPAAFAKLEASKKKAGTPINGWHIPPKSLGNFGNDYGLRAFIALIAFGANLPADAVYPTAFVDAANKPLNGANRYVLHFNPGMTPPVNAFWSVTMYDSQSFFVDNPIHRYAISSWMPLQKNGDGSIDLYIQHESPGESKDSNWLPAPKDDFNVTLRMYWPKDKTPSINDGTWVPPAVTQTP